MTDREEQAKVVDVAEGEMVDMPTQPVSLRRRLSPELQAAFDDVWHEGEAGFRYLADRD